MATEKKEPTFNAKEMLAENAKKERKVNYGDRMKVEILIDTKHYKKGRVINPHLVVAEKLIESKIAKEIK